VEYARQPGTGFFDVGTFTQRVAALAGDHREESDELLYVLEGAATVQIGGEEHALGAGCAFLAPAGVEWSASGDARAVSVLVHDAERTDAPEVRDLAAVEKGTATAGRQFVLGPECASATQFIGLIPPGRAPDHYHEYDEVIYVLEGEGVLEIDGEQAPLGPGTCVHLPRRLVHCLANTGDSEMRVLGVFRPAGSPAEAYYPDGTLAVVPDTEE
jgi:quercetin dioxygenase-like cupin family protein